MPLERSSIDWALLPGIIEAALAVRTREQFLQWTCLELQAVLPHAATTCGAVLKSPSGLQTRSMLCAERRALAAADRSAQNDVLLVLLKNWCNEQSPQFFEPFASDGTSENAALHGVPQWASGAAIYFCFSGIPARLTPRHAKLLEWIVPHMYMALGRTAGFSRPGLCSTSGEPAGSEEASLTRREGEILKLLRNGANNKAIAAGLCLSAHTVRHHLESIYAKLNVRNRGQAVAKTFSAVDAGNG